MKPAASIYLHCDPTASHYLKVLMDAVFGPRNFRNEVIWQRSLPHNDPKKFGATHDVILVYSKLGRPKFHQQFTGHSESYKASHYARTDPDGRAYQLTSLAASGLGPARRFGDKWIDPPPGDHWRWSQEHIDDVWTQGLIVITSGGKPRFKRYLDEQKGSALQTIWVDIPGVNSQAKERLGYDTQKPEALLDRIIRASSDEGDVVLDPFCGCGTATVAAHRLRRRWIGIDITYLAVDLMRRRLLDTFPGDFPDGIHVDGDPADEAAALALAERDKYQFQFWAVAKIGGTARGGENRKGMDRGIDGVLTFPEQDGADKPETRRYEQVIVSVKGGATGPAHVRDLRGTMEREKAPIGVLVVTEPPTREMERDAAAASVYHSPWDGSTYSRIQILTAGDLIHSKRVDMPSQRGTSDFARAPRARRGRQPRLDI